MTPRPPTRSRRGTFIPLLAVCAATLLAFVALAIDLGMLTLARTQCQNAADSCALAAARALNARPGSTDAGYANALATVNAVAPQNSYVGGNFSAPGAAASQNAPGLEVGLYEYNSTDGAFATNFTNAAGNPPTGRVWTSARVTLSVNQPLFFARVFPTLKGANPTMPGTWQNGATATAVHRPRDIALILDYSGSMRFGSTFNWGEGNRSPALDGGSLSNDPVYPQFGHYQRYTAYNTANPNAGRVGDPGTRPNPLYTTVGYTAPGSGELLAPSNYTATNSSGPACVNDFYTDPAAAAGAVPNVTYNPTTNVLGNAQKAFYAPTSSVGIVTPASTDFGTQSFTDPATYTGGDLWPRKYGAVVTGADAASWNPVATSTTNGTGAAVNAAEYLGWVDRFTGVTAVKSLARVAAAPTTTARPWTQFRDAAWERYGYDLDVGHYVTNRPTNWDPRWDWQYTTPGTPSAGGSWQHPGGGGSLPTNATMTNSSTTPLKVNPGRFKGYTLGPGYWGKTFFVWPPDPRAPVGTDPATAGYVAGDWRRRFFLTSGGAAMAGTQATSQALLTSWTANTRSANNSVSTDNTNLNVGHTLRPAPHYSGSQNVTELSGSSVTAYTHVTPGATPTNFQVDYPAVLRWIKSGPQVFPPNLRAGRLVYYTSIPTDVNHGTTGNNQNPTTSANRIDLDKLFWRTYIDYVLEQFSRGMKDLAGFEQVGWPESGTTGTTGASIPNVDSTAVPANGFDVDGVGTGVPSDPLPYSDYRDNPSRPRMHLWFGPMTMMAFIANGVGPMFAGTTHEAQAWQLKAAINSGLDDIRYNHPNDFVGMTYFSSGTWNSGAVVNSGQSWNALKDALFYPRTMATDGTTTTPSTVRANVNAEYWPFYRATRTMTYQGNGNVPNANGGTTPSAGFALAYNTLLPTGGGRRGASKIVIFETDGVPNTTCTWTTNNNGYNSSHTGVGSYTGQGEAAAGAVVSPTTAQATTTPAGHPAQMTQVYGLIRDRFLPNMSTSTSGTSGTSLPSSPTRIYAIAFGDLFSNTSATQRANALAFLLTVQKYGGTSNWADTSLPTNQIITGDYQTRIDNLRATLERILQSGVQVTLIE